MSPSSVTSTSSFISSSDDDSLKGKSVSLGVGENEGSAYRAIEITPNDTVIETEDRHRLPGVPLCEARKLNALRSKKEEEQEGKHGLLSSSPRRDETSPHVVIDAAKGKIKRTAGISGEEDETHTNIERAPASTNPLFPPLPVYGPATPLRRLQWSIAKSIPVFVSNAIKNLKGVDPDASRPFNEIEKERAEKRRLEEAVWRSQKKNSLDTLGEAEIGGRGAMNRQRTGGKDKLLCDVGYYARRVGLELEEFQVETEDGFLINLQHIFDPDDPPYYPGEVGEGGARVGRKNDPRMWAWNIRQMGILDLPAFIDHILARTHFKKLGLVCHSQGTTQTFVALAKQQRPDIGEKITVFCALAPAVYAGPLIDKFYFKFMKIIPPSMFRIVFGIHAFIPFMLTMHSTVPASIYGALGYRVFWFLFGWSDRLWDRGLRSRFFQFAPVYVSSETLRWWLGGFARHRCILSTHTEEEEEAALEEAEEEQKHQSALANGERPNDDGGDEHSPAPSASSSSSSVGGGAWYDSRCPPIALWIAGSDDLVDGARLLRRFDKGKEPDVRLVHRSVIEEYEHLDVIWAVDAVEKVFKGVKEVIWECAEEDVKGRVVVPKGCSP
ncbi:uncharacterized protein H6S33_002255 [Morchella sextelata]|uniref:uncharacterized protein n=1 Tax=Morchella sextelata TaxID=1174677 RepID=UPI001D048884|nr:uncharacterized protein H6S33_002255 [Morchella sextelata]KAH0608203.1 hypothetical protein H6S33_002255 [Morchella sextelata]